MKSPYHIYLENLFIFAFANLMLQIYLWQYTIQAGKLVKELPDPALIG